MGLGEPSPADATPCRFETLQKTYHLSHTLPATRHLDHMNVCLFIHCYFYDLYQAIWAASSMRKSEVQPLIALVLGGSEILLPLFFRHGTPDTLSSSIRHHVEDLASDE